MKLIGSSSPHIRDGVSTRRLMLCVILALLPSCAVGVIRGGWHALAIVGVAVAAAVAAEAGFCALRRQPIPVGDWSAVVTGLLVGMNMPPTVPLYIPAAGSLFAVIIVKQLFGGLGGNFVNPALTARAFLMAAWSVPMTFFGTDAVSSATLLPQLTAGTPANISLLDAFIGRMDGCIGETCTLALLLGGLFLIAIRVIDWRIPVCFLGSTAIFSLLVSGNATFTLYQMMAGGLMLGAFFMATDYVTSPVTAWGRVLYGIGCGVITCVIRFYGAYPEGTTYAILLMNVATPLIEKITAPRVFGRKRGRHA